MRSPRLLSLVVLCAALLLAVPASASARPSDPVAHASDVKTMVAGKLAQGGFNYLVGQLNDGLLGQRGKDVAGFLTDVGLYDNTKEQLSAIRDDLNVIQTGLDNVASDVAVANDKIDALSGQVANGFYSQAVAAANPLTSAVFTGQKKLIAIADAAPADRGELTKQFVEFYDRSLLDKQLEFEGFMIGRGPSADGVMQLASKKARGAAQPFYLAELSDFPRQVAGYYALVYGEWVELQLNYMDYHHQSLELREAAIADARGYVDDLYRAIPTQPVLPNTVIDTRKPYLEWTWTVDPTRCYRDTSLKTAAAINGCMYSLGPHPVALTWSASRGAYAASGWGTPPTNGSPPDTWRLPTVSEVQGLIHDAVGGTLSWLAERGGFPAALNGEVWTSDSSGEEAKTVDLASGSVQWRPKSEKHFYLLTGASGFPTLKLWL